jgi:hypothetical protein
VLKYKISFQKPVIVAGQEVSVSLKSGRTTKLPTQLRKTMFLDDVVQCTVLSQ